MERPKMKVGIWHWDCGFQMAKMDLILPLDLIISNWFGIVQETMLSLSN
jgi:hypothetical protein